jgi:hypothetical protein
VRAVNKNTLLIGSNHLNLFKNILERSQLRQNFIIAESSPGNFLNKVLGQEPFVNLVIENDVCILHFGLLGSYEDDKIKEIQKLIWYLYSINNKLEIYISFLPTEDTPDLSIPELTFDLKNCELLVANEEKIYDYKDDVVDFFFLNVYNCSIPPQKEVIKTKTSVSYIKYILNKKEGYTTQINDEYNRIL